MPKTVYNKADKAADVNFCVQHGSRTESLQVSSRNSYELVLLRFSCSITGKQTQQCNIKNNVTLNIQSECVGFNVAHTQNN